MSSRVLTAVAWPYANGPRHIGHVSGFGVPSDVFSRYRRMAGDAVLMVSGTDEHGTPDPGAGRRRGAHPARARRQVQPGDRRRPAGPRAWRTTCSPARRRRTTTRSCRSCSSRCTENGYVVPRTAMGAISPSTGRTLPDRYVEGTCPICGYDGARGDQCDNCGNQLDPADLINPRSRINGEAPKFVETEHFFLDLPAFADSLGSWLSTRTDWRPNVLKFAANLVDDLKPRAITRDLDWGVPVPARRLARPADEAALRLVRRRDRLPVGVGRVGPARAGPGRLEAVVDRPGRPWLLLHGQGQHRLPLGDLAGAAARARTGRATTAARRARSAR